ncbi:MAG: hypothetical protein KatS3mg113_0680 [Planctomycetaceae bacterium]|nr:MAG: hypothetical protein KatS3mg113_0680 [Planctomycetaceae bacterium]
MRRTVDTMQPEARLPDHSVDTPWAGGAVHLSFAELAASRRRWIDDILRPWCTQASRAELLLAEHDWINLAGQVDPQKTLWLWAWSRFPSLVHLELGIDEAHAVIVTLRDGRQYQGYPDARLSTRGELVLVAAEHRPYGSVLHGPFSIDSILSIHRTGDH